MSSSMFLRDGYLKGIWGGIQVCCGSRALHLHLVDVSMMAVDWLTKVKILFYLEDHGSSKLMIFPYVNSIIKQAAFWHEAEK